VRKEVAADTESAPPSAVNSLAPSVSADDASEEAQDDNSDGGDRVGSP
jgi:hypothetical protein